MYDILKTIIESGDYEVTDILHKIDVFFAEGKLSEEQRDELIGLAEEGAVAPNPPVDGRLDAIDAKIADLTARIEKLEGTGPGPSEYPEYDVYAVYNSGDRCTYKGSVYEWIHPTAGNWAPDAYPAAWKKVEE